MFLLMFLYSKNRNIYNTGFFIYKMEFNDDEIKATILYHLRRKKVIGGVHTPFDTITRGFPSHLGKEIKKIASVQKAAEEILRIQRS